MEEEKRKSIKKLALIAITGFICVIVAALLAKNFSFETKGISFVSVIVILLGLIFIFSFFYAIYAALVKKIWPWNFLGYSLSTKSAERTFKRLGKEKIERNLKRGYIITNIIISVVMVSTLYFLLEPRKWIVFSILFLLLVFLVDRIKRGVGGWIEKNRQKAKTVMLILFIVWIIFLPQPARLLSDFKGIIVWIILLGLVYSIWLGPYTKSLVMRAAER